MKSIKTNKKPSYKDNLSDGSRAYYCPKCELQGHTLPSSTILVEYTGAMVRNGKIDLRGAQRGDYICDQCGEKIADNGYMVK